MRLKIVGPLAFVSAPVIVFFLAVGGVLTPGCSSDSQQADQLAKLKRKALQQASVSVPTSVSMDELAAQGKGMPLTPELFSAIVEDGGYWFVGKDEDGGGVEIPFEPGKLPMPPRNGPPVNANPGYVGPDSCQECHPKFYDTFVETSHYRTTRPCGPGMCGGDFDAGGNKLLSGDPNLSFEMIEREGDLFQRVNFFDWKFEVPMQMVTGSSKLAESYLYWHGDRLYQHNVTYLTEGDQWINSPGYIDGDAAYARPVPARCLDCHTTYFDVRKPPNSYTPESIIFGVTCERCHGPASDHVTFHRENPGQREAHAIVLPSSLSRQRQLDVCGQCHAGSTQLKGDPFTFRPGDVLMDHYDPPPPGTDAANSVHTSNQLVRLSESACFQASEMTCIDCHNPHENERGNRPLASSKCIECHQENGCSFDAPPTIRLSDNCIDCHMPTRPTEKLILRSTEGDVFPALRDHKVRVDQEATAEFLKASLED